MEWYRPVLQLKGSVLLEVLPRVLIAGGFGCLVSFLHSSQPTLDVHNLGDLTNNVACNLVLGLLLVFRTNTAYDRFWEGRKAWGTIVVSIRNLARAIKLTLNSENPVDQELNQAALKLLSAFAIATKLHLRQQPITNELDPFLSSDYLTPLKQAPNPPLQLVLWLGDYCQQSVHHQRIDTTQHSVMNQLLNEMIAGLTSCERILKTPIPPVYAIFLKRLILLYCLCLPFGLVDQLQGWTGLVVATISFVLFGVEAIGSEIENPFGTDPNDLPVDEICTTICSNVESTMAFVTRPSGWASHNSSLLTTDLDVL